jgi:hypothetical protein
VSVIGRPDLVVRFRRGFGEPPQQTAKDKPKEATPPPARKPSNEEINSVLGALYPATAMPVAISLSYLDTAQYGGTLTTTIRVGTGSLALDPQPSGALAAVDVAGLVLNDQGKSVSSFNKRFTIKPTTNNADKLPENIFYNDFALVKPGLYQVRVAAIDVKAGTRGSAYEWIEVPDVTKSGLTMSSLVVGEKKPEIETQPVAAKPNDPQPPPPLKQVVVNVDHRFAGSSALRFLTFVYNAAVRPASSTTPGNSTTMPAGAANTTFPDLAVQVQVFRDGEPVITTPLHKIQTEGTQDVRRVPYAADVSLEGLKAGAYVLQVTVIDRIAKTSASRKLSFQIE